jgi:hypothetical protein
MLIIGIILIIVGAALYYFFQPERLLMFIGAVLALVGLVLVIVAILGSSDVNVDSTVVAGTFVHRLRFGRRAADTLMT